MTHPPPSTPPRSTGGFSLLELLIGLALGSLLLVTVLSNTQQTLHTVSAFRRFAGDDRSFERIELTFRTYARNAGTFPSVPWIALEQANTTGPLRAAAQLGTAFPPDHGSAVIVFRQPRKDLMFVRHATRQSIWCERAIFSTDNTSHPSPIGFLLLSFDGVFSLRGSLRSSPLKADRCADPRQFIAPPELRPLQLAYDSKNGMPVDPAPASWFGLLPLEDEFSVYLDQQGSLRHASLLNRANRVIASGIKTFSAEIQSSSGVKAAAFHFGLESGAERSFRIIIGSEGYSPLDLVF